VEGGHSRLGLQPKGRNTSTRKKHAAITDTKGFYDLLDEEKEKRMSGVNRPSLVFQEQCRGTES